MQLFCSELAFNLTVLSEHVGPEYLFICDRNQTYYRVQNVSLETDQTLQRYGVWPSCTTVFLETLLRYHHHVYSYIQWPSQLMASLVNISLKNGLEKK